MLEIYLSSRVASSRKGLSVDRSRTGTKTLRNVEARGVGLHLV